MDKEFVIFLLQCVTGVAGHPENGEKVLKFFQSHIKSDIAEKPDLQDIDVLQALDLALKLSSIAQVPATYRPTPFNLSDYVAPVSEPEAPVEELPEAVEVPTDEMAQSEEHKEDIPF